jgi:hypothetical protein
MSFHKKFGKFDDQVSLNTTIEHCCERQDNIMNWIIQSTESYTRSIHGSIESFSGNLVNSLTTLNKNIENSLESFSHSRDIIVDAVRSLKEDMKSISSMLESSQSYPQLSPTESHSSCAKTFEEAVVHSKRLSNNKNSGRKRSIDHDYEEVPKLQPVQNTVKDFAANYSEYSNRIDLAEDIHPAKKHRDNRKEAVSDDHPKQKYSPVWLKMFGGKTHSTKQVESGDDLKLIPKTCINCVCIYCAKFQPNNPWASVKPRRDFGYTGRRHEQSEDHKEAERLYLSSNTTE